MNLNTNTTSTTKVTATSLPNDGFASLLGALGTPTPPKDPAEIARRSAALQTAMAKVAANTATASAAVGKK